MTYQLLKGSERGNIADAVYRERCDVNENVRVMLVLRFTTPDDEYYTELHDSIDPQFGGICANKPLSRASYARKFGADEADLEHVRAFARHYRLSVEREHAASRTVFLTGTVEQMEQAFRVSLARYDHKHGAFRGRAGGIYLPGYLQGVVIAVLGLDERLASNCYLRMNDAFSATAKRLSGYTPLELAELYHFPEHDGAGQCIGIIELGGGYRLPQLAHYFKRMGVNPPQVVDVCVGGAKNALASSDGDKEVNPIDIEVQMDIEIAGTLAPAAKIVVYFAPNTDAGFLEAINAAIHDEKNAPSVISISWGASESEWTAQSLQVYNQAFQTAAALGITVCVASGDHGSQDGEPHGLHVDFPASSPYVLACGGTRLQKAMEETTWHNRDGGATGGGVSQYFALPGWQLGMSLVDKYGGHHPLQHRGVPDVSGNADPETGYLIEVNGLEGVVGGTSAVAPLWAGLLARMLALTHSASLFIPPLLYRNRNSCKDIVRGNNGAFVASEGWDACTGLGSPDGMKLLRLLKRLVRLNGNGVRDSDDGHER
ncbi:S53 family peptidase [Pectobacterium carotovorum]|uniref:S53 family peptidase n=1 Tax=Pectobacterium carotovorum TaxID=554 RepID=UPI001CF53854|nr:S53 family peptidase [Pectobacterium carotovorum]MCA6970380.1 S53 family peptidase [Pectobacterium carotovorum]